MSICTKDLKFLNKDDVIYSIMLLDFCNTMIHLLYEKLNFYFKLIINHKILIKISISI